MCNNRRGIIISPSFFFLHTNANWKTASKTEEEWISISRGHLISRRRSIFFPIVLDTFYYSLWCWYTDGGPVLEGLLSPFTFSISFSQHNSRRYRRQTGQVGGCSTPVRHDQYATLLFCYRAHPLSHSHIHGDTCARARVSARVHQLSRFPLPHSFPLSMHVV